MVTNINGVQYATLFLMLTIPIGISKIIDVFTLSVKSNYGLLALLTMGLNGTTQPMQSRVIGEVNHIPHAYLEQLLLQLKKSGFIKSVRGKHGGYLLAKPMTDILINDVLSAIEGPLSLSDGFSAHCVIGSFWREIESMLSGMMSKSLADLVNDHQSRNPVLSYDI